MCYPSCPRGPGRWRRKADHCWQDCYGGYKNTGLFCTRKSWGGWRRSRLRVHTRKKRAVWKRAKSLIVRGTCATVHGRPEDRGGLCYRRPRRHYKCRVTMCHIHCGNGETILNRECGMQCISGGGFQCFTHIMNLVMLFTQAIIQTAALVLSFGASASATAASAGARATL
eukprot:TRINITY_DN3098_c0_g1_i2.p1 TRINITY_DN3098_c0_g1~~TRINITY_DN3098_c0_g1_i2.p1  ORF type:complete len:170 (+),score=2.86 TRINITY_DN3098_c0_g1_i2:3-512(+)